MEKKTQSNCSLFMVYCNTVQTLNSKGALMSNVSNSYKVIQIHNNTK